MPVLPPNAQALCSATELARRFLALSGRQVNNNNGDIIPTNYFLDGPSPGTIVGIVLGAVLGTWFVVWLIFTLANGGRNSGTGRNYNIRGEEEFVVRTRDKSSRSKRSRHSHRDAEIREVSHSPRHERVLVNESRDPQTQRISRSILVEERRERRVPGDDVVEVIEDHSDFTPFKHSQSRSRSRSRR